MDATWLAWNLETFPGGCSSAVSPDLLPPNQLAWGMNASFRGSKVRTRPNIACRSILPSGLIQGVGYFSVQGGMLVAMISGKPYRIRIGHTNADFSHEPIPLPWYNSGIIKQVWMVQTVESLIIQDGQSNAIIYDGSSARRADPTTPQVPRGMQMAYGNGRLWVAVEGNQLVAGDIRTTVPGSELSFTETQYLSGGGALFFPNGITGLAFIPVVGTTDYGALLVYGANNLETVRADITQRDQWASYPGFVTNALRNIGTPSGWTLVQVNQDLFWRDSLGGIRSLNSSEAGAYFAQYQGAIADANTPLSREVSRLVDFDSQQLLGFSSGVYFDNRLLMTSSPFLNLQGGVSWRDLVSLDFAPVSTMQQKAPPAYNGAWQGVNWTQLVSGQFDGRIRAFGVSSDDDGVNRLWEFDTGETDDVYLSFSDGSGGTATQPIESFAEYPRVNFNDPKRRKRLTRCDVWLSEITGEVSLTVYYRADNQQKWTLWDEVMECATLTDDSQAAPHVWKNLPPQERPQIKTFTIPDTVDDLIDYAASVGFGFQVRLVWTGSIKIERVSLWAVPLDDPDYADRTGQGPECAMNDVSGNEIVYEIPLAGTIDPVVLPVGGNYGSAQTITMTCATADALINYTTDGSTPSATHGTLYTGAISLDGNTTLKAIAFHPEYTSSNVITEVYRFTCVTPVFSPVAGSYNNAQSVTISTTTPAAAIRYTTDGSIPTESHGTLYAGPVAISAASTLKAIAYKTNYTNSPVASGVYVFSSANPVFSPVAGSYGTDQIITITSSTSGATIRYTTDGSIPTESHGTVYSGGISVSVPTTVTFKAVAYKSGYSDSSVISAAYVVECSYVIPGDMQPSTALFQGFSFPDFTSTPWTTEFSQTYGAGFPATVSGQDVIVSENGQYVIVLPRHAAGGVVILTRSGSSFSAQNLNIPAGYGVSDDLNAGPTWSISRTGIIAGFLVDTSTFNLVGAVWSNGFSSAPTIDTAVTNGWYWINHDATKLIGQNATQIFIRENSVDTVIANDSSFSHWAYSSYCGNTVALNDGVSGRASAVYRLISGTWQIVGVVPSNFTLSAVNYNSVTISGISGDGNYMIGWAQGSSGFKPFMWDLTALTAPSTAPITPTLLPLLAGSISSTTSRALAISSDGSVIFGDNSTVTDGATYWLKSENFATAHSLVTYATAQGLGANFGNTSGLYTSNPTTQGVGFYMAYSVAATGAHFVWMVKKHTTNYTSIAYMAMPPL